MSSNDDIKIFLDSGAHSLYNRFSRKKVMGKNNVGANYNLRKHDNFDYVNAPEYIEFRSRYVDFVKEHSKILEAHINLDVVFNPELTYKNQKWLEKQGITPLPVWHLGLDEKYLQRYLDEGYEYICLGGMSPNPVPILKVGLDSLWRRVLTDKDGMPRAKFHGLALTSFPLMCRYPWYSVDSKSWVSHGQFGGILVPPRKRDGSPDWLNPMSIKVCEQTTGRVAAQRHIATMTASKKKYVLSYLKTLGIPLGRSRFKRVKPGYELKENEQWISVANNINARDRIPAYRRAPEGPKVKDHVEIVEEPGVVNTSFMRMDVNSFMYRMIEKTIPKWPWALPHKIKHGKVGLFK